MAHSIKQAGLNIQIQITDRLDLAGQIIIRDAIKGCPVDLGQLRASWEIKKADDGIRVGFYNEYAYYVHEGTGIHASNGMGRKTPWFYPYKGKMRRTQGQKPNPFLKKAFDKNKKDIVKILKG